MPLKFFKRKSLKHFSGNLSNTAEGAFEILAGAFRILQRELLKVFREWPQIHPQQTTDIL